MKLRDLSTVKSTILICLIFFMAFEAFSLETENAANQKEEKKQESGFFSWFFKKKPVIPQEGLAAEGKGEWDLAIEIYKAQLSNEPNRPDLWIRIADIDNRLKRYPQAADDINNAIKIEPENDELYVRLSETYATAGKAKEALAAIDKAHQLKPDNIQYLKRRAILANWAKDNQTMIDSYNKILQIDPKDQDSQLGLMHAKAFTNIPSNQTVQPNASSSIPAEGLNAENNQKWDEAITIYKNALAKDPNRVDLWLRIADIENRLKHYQNGTEALENAIKIKSNDADLWARLSQSYAVMKQPEKALNAINEALKIQPNNIEYLKRRAMLANWAHKPNEAEDSYKRILQIDPNNQEAQSELQHFKSQASNITGANYISAINAIKRKIELDPCNPSLYEQLSQIYSNNKQPYEALEAINSALALDPCNIKYLKTRAIIASLLQCFDEVAENSYCRILQIDPCDKEALLGMAHLKTKLNFLDSAVQYYERYLYLYPNSKQEWIDYASVQSWRGNYNASYCALETYCRRFGGTKEYWAATARLEAMAGYGKSALCIVRRLLQDFPCDYNLRFTEILALNDIYAYSETLCKFNNLLIEFPDHDKDNQSLCKDLVTPLRSNINLDPYTYHDSDHINVNGILVFGQYFIRPELSILYGAKYEVSSAIVGSGLEPITGQPSVSDGAQWIGFINQFSPELKIGGGIGIGEIQRRSPFFIYEADIISTPCEEIQIEIQKGQNLYSNLRSLENNRVLYAISPRSVSLGILQYYNRAVVSLEPCVQKYLYIAYEYDTFSDHNRLNMVQIAPHMSALNTQYLNLDMGFYGVWYSFAHQFNNGYYDPKSYRLYQATSALVIKQSENTNYIISVAAGTQQDNTMPHAEFAGDLSIKGIFGIFMDWELIVSGAAIARNSGTTLPVQTNQYRQYTAEVVLTRRF